MHIDTVCPNIVCINEAQLGPAWQGTHDDLREVARRLSQRLGTEVVALCSGDGGEGASIPDDAWYDVLDFMPAHVWRN